MENTTKKYEIMQYALENGGAWKINSLHFILTGSKHGVRWHEPNIKCSKSTVRRALEQLVADGLAEASYRYGHCFDELIYRII